MNATVIESDVVPLGASEGDKWIDTFNDRALWVCNADYSSVVSTLTVPNADRPGSINLLFTALAVGGNGDLIDVAILNAGASGTSALVKTGTGAVADRFLYTFNVYDDDSSNNALIALLSGDPDLTASGTDATDGTFNELTLGTLSGGIAFWDKMIIHIDYVAELPTVTDTTKDISLSIPIDIRNSLSEKLAAALLIQDEGADKTTMTMYDDKFSKANMRATKHRSQGTAPADVTPG